jgi:hypothetical protein
MDQEDGDLNNWDYFVNAYDDDDAFAGRNIAVSATTSAAYGAPPADRTSGSNRSFRPTTISQSTANTVPTANPLTMQTAEGNGQELPAPLRDGTTMFRAPLEYSDSNRMMGYPHSVFAPSIQASNSATIGATGQQFVEENVPAYVIVNPAHPESFFLPMQLLTYQATDGPQSVVWGPVSLPSHLLPNQQSQQLHNHQSQLNNQSLNADSDTKLARSMRDPESTVDACAMRDEHDDQLQQNLSIKPKGKLTLTSTFEPIGFQKTPSSDSSTMNQSPLSSAAFQHHLEASWGGEQSMPAGGFSSLSSATGAGGFSISTQDRAAEPSKASTSNCPKKRTPMAHSESETTGMTPVLKPLSAYNYFFRDERDNIVNWQGEGLPPPVQDWTGDKRQALLNEHWYKDPTKGKRIHRKTHGKLGFAEYVQCCLIVYNYLVIMMICGSSFARLLVFCFCPTDSLE